VACDRQESEQAAQDQKHAEDLAHLTLREMRPSGPLGARCARARR
jgi:hypothetical protein